MISRETAYSILHAHQEIAAAEKLLADMADTLGQNTAPDIRDAFGHRQRGLQLGVPSGENGHRLFNVQWSLARPVIEAHIAQQRAALVALNEKARAEIDAPPTAAQEG